MPWTERQRAMLGAMGITVWAPAADDGAADASVPPQPATAQAPVRAEVARAAPPALGVRSARDSNDARRAPRVDGDVATLDWLQLRERVAACRACRLCEGRTQTVFGVGNEQAHCMIVGEAPGENE